MEEQKLLKRKQKALKENNALAVISASISLAELYFREENYEHAIEEYKLVAKKYKSLHNMIDYARSHRMIGEAYAHLRDYNKALEHQQIHLLIAKEEKNRLEEQRALATIGHTYLTSYLDRCDENDKSSLNLAYKSFMKSLAVCETLTGISKIEHMDMSARLFANLGVVQESMGNYDKGIELVQKSINVCKANDIYEQLQRGYTLLGSLYTKKEKYSSAIHQYNLAIEVAGRLEEKIPLTCTALSLKADLLVKLADFHGAKDILLKAYKLKNPSPADRDNIERSLKTVAALCYTEEQLLTTSETDYETRKKLYEKMGDGASELKNYPKAIEYYQKMLAAAEKRGESGADLSPCYVSLAQTYSDNKEYDSAIEYFEKDFGTTRNNATEAINTLFSIADVMEAAGRDFREIECVYEQARTTCRSVSDARLEGKVVSRHKTLLEKNRDETGAKTLRDELERLRYVTASDSDSESTPHTPTIGDDIDIEDITDVSDGEAKEEKRSRGSRKRTGTFAIKRNNKGETQLHTACISGNYVLVVKLVDQGHAVNVRDNCGWLPIHEACICGHLEIVKTLIEKGAAINDRGGTLCNGMTPLHDAASNGHLPVIELLLDNGANVVSKTDEGETPLHVLQRWRDSVQLDDVERTHYECIVGRMTNALEKSGQNTLTVRNANENSALVIDDDEEPRTTHRRSGEARMKRTIGSLRRSNTIESDSDSSDDRSKTARSEYRRVMQNLRRRTSDADCCDVAETKTAKRSALLSPDEVGDDWLVDDDVGSASAKRRRTNAFLDMANPRKSSPRKKSSLDKENLTSRNGDHLENVPISSDDELSASGGSSSNPTAKRKRQTSLIAAGFSRRRSGTPTSSGGRSALSSQKRKLQSKLSSFVDSDVAEADSTTEVVSRKTSPANVSGGGHVLPDQTLFVDVRIMERLYRVPVPYSEINTLTIGWLGEEASKRYSRKESMKPTLELETKNGAFLAEDDLLSILFPMGSIQSEEVNAKVLKWNLPPMIERYREACNALNIGEDAALSKVLQETSTVLSVANHNLQSESMSALCRALNRQTNLVHLDLSGNFTLREATTAFCAALPSLQNLSLLNLSATDIDSDCLGTVSRTFSQNDNPILENLVSLDLSHNPLGDDSLRHLAIISRHLKLKVLRLRDVDFTKNIFDNVTNKYLELYLDYLECLDLGYNELDKGDVMKFLSWIRPESLESLDVSSNSVTESGLVAEIVCLLQSGRRLSLRCLDFSRCRATDSEVYELLGVLGRAENFDELNLSYNEDLTSISLRRICQHAATLRRVNFAGCENLAKYFEDSWEFCETNSLNSLKLSLDFRSNRTKCDKLVGMWKRKHEYNCDVTTELSNFLSLSVSNQ